MAQASCFGHVVKFSVKRSLLNIQ